MITKAIIKRLNTPDDNHFKVYIPLLRKANNTESDAIFDATLIYIKGLENNFNVNDVVYVGFENNQYDKPAILGSLYLGKDDKSKIGTTATFKSIEVKEISKFSTNTAIGDLSVSKVNKKVNNLIDKSYLKNSDSPAPLFIHQIKMTGDRGCFSFNIPLYYANKITKENFSKILGGYILTGMGASADLLLDILSIHEPFEESTLHSCLSLGKGYSESTILLKDVFDLDKFQIEDNFVEITFNKEL